MAVTVTQPVQPEVQNKESEKGIDPKDGQEKFIYSYQPRDSEGQFIGKPYKYFYTDQQDLVRQVTEGKEQGDRYIHEVKTGKRQLQGEPARPQPEFTPAPESTEEADRKRREEFRKTIKEEFGADVDEVRNRVKTAGQLNEFLAAQSWALNKQAEGYYPCAENAKTIGEWLKKENLANTTANYDRAFEELRDSLAQAPKEPVAPADSTQTAVPTRAEAKPQSTGIIPGQFQGTRPGQRTERQPLTMERFRQIDKMGRDAWKKLERTNPKEASAFQAMKYGAQPQQ